MRRTPSADTAVGLVFEQDPGRGTKTDKGNLVTILVSTGKPKTRVPGVVGQSVADAVQTLANSKLKASAVEINSDKPVNTVTAQDPKAGTVLVEGSSVRINVSKGPKPIAVPSVVGQPYPSAVSVLQGAGFAIGPPQQVDSDQPKDTVVGQSPGGGSFATKGTTVTLQVSKGPKTSGVPDVTSQDVDTARATLEGSGFKVKVIRQDTADPTFDNVVISQDPPGSSQAKPKTVVTITVGHFTGTGTTGTTATVPTP